MIKVTVREDRLTVSGHADYVTEGEDIICAAVTALTGTLVKSIENLTEDEIEYDARPGLVDIRYKDLSEKAKTLVDSFFIGICMTDEIQPGYIRIL